MFSIGALRYEGKHQKLFSNLHSNVPSLPNSIASLTKIIGRKEAKNIISLSNVSIYKGLYDELICHNNNIRIIVNWLLFIINTLYV